VKLRTSRAVHAVSPRGADAWGWKEVREDEGHLGGRDDVVVKVAGERRLEERAYQP